MGLNKEQIKSNKDLFLSIISKLEIPHSNIDGLVKYLETSDFFTAPFSTQYAGSYEGGLCEKSLNIYNALKELCSKYAPEVSQNTIIVIGLLCNVYKSNYYEKVILNKKVYNEEGSKSDSLGSFDWISVESYKIKEASERFIIGSNGLNSYMLISNYIPLTNDEMCAIINFDCGMSEGYRENNLYEIISNNKLVSLTHSANLIATYVIK